MEIKKTYFAVFGNPIDHSQSPKIHSLFSQYTKIIHHYSAIHVPLGKITNVLDFFFSHDGKGGNITLPFKEEVFNFCNLLTESAEISGAVNTLKKLKNGRVLGDNTDGIGIQKDLERLKFIKKKYNILLIGAGGAARGIIFTLLSSDCFVFITNRNMKKAETIEKDFKKFGKIVAIDFNDLSKIKFNLIINATSSGIDGLSPILPDEIISPDTYCYDISYQSLVTPFLSWCKKLGAVYISNGIGMLVGQAAYSFFLWHGVLPNIIPIINILTVKDK
ncbi:Shikimate dehydrogenase (NADP(+)) [Buchnera aphidicola (Pemphigus populi)]